MKISKSAQRQAKQLLRSCIVDGMLDEGCVREAARKVAVTRARGYMAVLMHFHRLVRLELLRRTARVESATPLPQHLQEQLTGDLNRLYGRGLRISFGQNPSLIGGLRVKVGSDVYDGTIQARLDKLSQTFGNRGL